ncbi:MAG: hypothetical protein KDD73_00505 [Anaerolineales bacterium]|nr:hypothetical protein [Anaerolineales bacterium]MCB9128391.1 hypothetical protein [Ardenticatenales bacterium]
MRGYPLDQLYEEVAFIAYYFHWPPETILTLEHGDRQRYVAEISAIHQRINQTGGELPGDTGDGRIPLHHWEAP